MADCNAYWCDFCDALTQRGDIGKTVEFERYLSDMLSSRTIFESDRFVVIPSLGQITEGYLLIITKVHYPSISHMPIENFDELEIVCDRVRTMLSHVYTRPIIFEHGPMPRSKEASLLAEGGGSCVDHAHFHCVPSPDALDGLLISLCEQFPAQNISKLNELKMQAERNMPYLFVETPDLQRYIFDAPIVLPQYLRRLLAARMGDPEKWNWHVYPEPERLLNTVNRLKTYIVEEA